MVSDPFAVYPSLRVPGCSQVLGKAGCLEAHRFRARVSLSALCAYSSLWFWLG
jgi:hypothetical protein